MEILNLPEYLKKNKGYIAKAKIVCMVNRQIPMPEHLKSYDSSSNIPVLVDIIGVELPKGKKYYVKGRGVAILGPTSLAPMPNNEKRVLLLESNIQSVQGQPNYVSLTNIFYNRNIGGYFLYATKTLFRDVNLVNNVYPEFVKIANKAQCVGCEKCFEGINFPDNYIKASEGVVFDNIDEKDKFVFKTKEDWYKDKQSELQSNVKSTPATNEPLDTVEYKNINDKPQGNKQELVCRTEIVDIPASYKKLTDGINKSKNSVEKKLEKLEQYRDAYVIDDAIDYTYRQLKKYWKKPKSKGVATGRAIFKEVLNRVYPDYKDKKRGSFSPIDYALDDMLYPALDIWYSGNYTGPTNKLLGEISVDRELIYIQIIDLFLELRGRLTEGYSYGKSLGLDMFSIIKTNPYYLTMIDNRFTIEHLDKLGMLYDLNMEDNELKAFRNAAYLHNLMLDSGNPYIKEDTLIKKSLITRVFDNGYILSRKTHELLQKEGMVIDETDLNGIIIYLESDVTGKQFKLPTDKWRGVKSGSTLKYVRTIEGENKEKAIQDYINSGLGVELNFNGVSYLSDYYYANKEKFIIERLYELSERGYRPEIDENEIEECIKAFENQKSLELNIPNFSLEERQKDAVRILYNPVMCLTGPAGSGKTTTAEALVFGLQNLLGVTEEEIMFCAPTGKAANRLKEIVKRPTRTIHSLFLVGGDSHSLLEEKEVKKKDDIGVLIVDESSMIKLDLMYDMVKKISNGTRVYFLGDREQLPPIGSGKPFANLLTFLPTVVLNVTKRASDGSGITRNAKKIIYESEKGNVAELEQADDFRILPDTMQNVVRTVKGICKYHLGQTNVKDYKKAVRNLGTDLLPDDIQVVTPINKHSWGTRNLNKELQDIFNPQQGLAIKFMRDFKFEKDENGANIRIPFYTEYRKGDRVIHLENQHKAKRFVKDGNFLFRKLEEEGIMNGDVGKVEGFYMASQMMFADDDDNELAEEFQGIQSTMYMAVEYTDMDIMGIPVNYIVLYKTEKLESRPDANNVIEVSSNDLRKVDLAYALTVHKLQGSQAKLIICVFFRVGYTDEFISRNMIYTAITRAKDGVYLIGDVQGSYSVITTGRSVEQVGKRLTITDKLY